MSTFEQSLVGSMAVTNHYLRSEQLEDALREQAMIAAQGRRAPRLGEILITKGYLTREQLGFVLNGQKGKASGLFGEIAENWGLCSGQHIDAALAEQIEYRMQRRRPRRIGEILVSRGALTAHQVHRIVGAQGKQIVQCPGCSTAYNALHLQPGASIICPRCNTVFTPAAPPTESTTDAEAVGDVHSDATALLPAVSGGRHPGGVSDHTAALPDLEFAPYRLVSRLGSDAAGFIYKATDAQARRTVALRVVSELAGDGGPDAWLRAATAAAGLDHPNLQRVVDGKLHDGRVLIASEYHQGRSLRQVLQEDGKLDVVETLNVLIQCAEALVYGLSHRVIHGDLRPSYVLVDASNRAHLCGLGLPKRPLANLKLITGSSGAAPLYTAPEVLRDAREVGETADVYSLCAIAYHLVTGRAAQIASMTHLGHIRTAPPKILVPRQINPLIPPYVSRLLMKGLSRHVEDRYPSALELLDDLRTCLSALREHVPDVPAVAPPALGVRSRVARAHVHPVTRHRSRRRQTAWSSRLGTRLTLTEPPAAAVAVPMAPPDDLCQSRIRAGTCVAMKKPAPVDRPWTVAAVVVALLLVVFFVASAALRENRPANTPPPPLRTAFLVAAIDPPSASSTETAPSATPFSASVNTSAMESDLRDLNAYQRAYPDRQRLLQNPPQSCA